MATTEEEEDQERRRKSTWEKRSSKWKIGHDVALLLPVGIMSSTREEIVQVDLGRFERRLLFCVGLAQGRVLKAELGQGLKEKMPYSYRALLEKRE